jgi:hypothetical protein
MHFHKCVCYAQQCVSGGWKELTFGLEILTAATAAPPLNFSLSQVHCHILTDLVNRPTSCTELVIPIVGVNYSIPIITHCITHPKQHFEHVKQLF